MNSFIVTKALSILKIDNLFVSHMKKSLKNNL